jgi:3,4-dihydroxy 2-butanone 4-phosphate synthase/GTP cyclohydrolase II
MESNFSAALDRFRRGEMVIVVDDHDRENEGDLIMLAEHATTEKTAFMVRHTTGILCVAITAEHAYRLRLPYMVEQNQDARKTAFTVSVDLAEGLTTGVSAQERTATIRALGSPTSRDTDFIRPGHIFPLIAHKRGLQARVGHTEAGVALAELTGGYPAALLSEIVAADGSMARGATLTAFAQEHQIPVISIAEIKSYQEKLEPLPRVLSYPRYEFEWVDVQLKTGLWNLATYPSLKHREQVVMRFGSGDKTPLVRLHSECFTGDVVSSQRCDCGQQLKESIAAIEAYYKDCLFARLSQPNADQMNKARAEIFADIELIERRAKQNPEMLVEYNKMILRQVKEILSKDAEGKVYHPTTRVLGVVVAGRVNRQPASNAGPGLGDPSATKLLLEPLAMPLAPRVYFSKP